MLNKKKLNQSKEIKIGAIISYVSVITNMLLGVLYTPWMLKKIGDSNYGLYSTATALISLFMLDFGLSAGVSRFISKYNARHDQESVNNFLGLVYKLYLGITVIIFILLTIVFFCIKNIYAGFTPGEIHKFRIVYIIASLSALIEFPFVTLNGILTSYENFIALKVCNLISRIMTVLFTVIALLCGQGLYTLVAVNAISSLMIIAVKLIIIKIKIPIKINFFYRSKKILKDIFNFSAWMTIGNIAGRFIYNVMPTIIGSVANTIAITRFTLASAIEGYVWTFSDALNGMFLPKVSRITAGDKTDGSLLALMIKVGRLNLIVSSMVALGFAVLGREFIQLWLGNDYNDVYLAALLLILPDVISQSQQIANTAIIALNEVKLQALIMCICSVVNIILSYFFVKKWGILGASISVCVAFFIKIILLNLVYYKKLQIDILEFFKQCHFKMIPALILITLTSTIMIYIIPLSGIVGFLVKGLCFIAVYVGITWCMSLNEYEKKLMIGLINRQRKKGKYE